MGFKSFFKRGDTPAAAKPVNDSGDGVQALRVRARRRLIGAAVLVAIGVVGFPLVFETQPRPIPVDLPINIPRKDAAVPLLVPPASAAPGAVADLPIEQPVPEAIAKQDSKSPVVPEARATDKPATTPAASPADKPLDKQAEKAVEKHVDKPVAMPLEKAPAKTLEKPAAKPAGEGARVQALLDGKAGDKVAAKGRFIVQVGAFAEASAAREARMKAEHIGLKTYLQSVDTPAGKRIRVRVGPFADRGEADKAAAKLKGTGLTTAVLTL